MRVAGAVERLEALSLVSAERERQDDKFGSQRKLPDDTWLRILVEEVGEVAMALNDKDSLEHTLEEIVQVAAVAVAWAEALIERVA